MVFHYLQWYFGLPSMLQVWSSRKMCNACQVRHDEFKTSIMITCNKKLHVKKKSQYWKLESFHPGNYRCNNFSINLIEWFSNWVLRPIRGYSSKFCSWRLVNVLNCILIRLFKKLITDRLFGDESDFLFWTVALYYLRAVKWSPKSQVRLDSSWVLPNKSANKPHSKGLNSFYSSGGFVLNLNYNKAL